MVQVSIHIEYLSLVLICYLQRCATAHPIYEMDPVLKVFVAVHKEPRVWREAWLQCFMENALLMSPLSDTHAKQMAHHLRHKRNPQIPIFTGFSAVYSKGDHFSQEGVNLYTVSNVQWKEKEPNNLYNREDCIGFYMDETLGDIRCDKPHAYICYKAAKSAETCGFDGYTYKAEYKSCYKFHHHPRTWSRAHMMCAAEGGYLAVINSQQEASYIATMYVQSQPKHPVRQFAFIGFSDLLEDRDFLTHEGTTLETAGYSTWAYGEPDYGKDKWFVEHCGSINTVGNLLDSYCEFSTYFICEIDR